MPFQILLLLLWYYLQVKIDWDSINAKVEAEYKQERERPAAGAQVRT